MKIKKYQNPNGVLLAEESPFELYLGKGFLWKKVSDNPQMYIGDDIPLEVRLNNFQDYPITQYFLEQDYKIQKERKNQNENEFIPFVPEKRIKLTNAGKATGAVTGTNVLDSLAKYGALANVSPVDAIGLGSQESKLGYFPTAAWDSSIIRKYLKNNPEGFFAGENIGVTPITLVNGAHYASNPYNDAIATVARKYTTSNSDATVILVDAPNSAKPQIEERLKLGKKYADVHAAKQIKEPILLHNMRFFKTGKYNPGDPNHTADVHRSGLELFNSPEIKTWWNNGGKEWYKNTEWYSNPIEKATE